MRRYLSCVWGRLVWWGGLRIVRNQCWGRRQLLLLERVLLNFIFIDVPGLLFFCVPILWESVHRCFDIRWSISVWSRRGCRLCLLHFFIFKGSVKIRCSRRLFWTCRRWSLGLGVVRIDRLYCRQSASIWENLQRLRCWGRCSSGLNCSVVPCELQWHRVGTPCLILWLFGGRIPDWFLVDSSNLRVFWWVCCCIFWTNIFWEWGRELGVALEIHDLDKGIFTFDHWHFSVVIGVYFILYLFSV